MRIYWHYYKTLLLLNIFISIALVFMAGGVSAYAGLFATVGYLASVYVAR